MSLHHVDVSLISLRFHGQGVLHFPNGSTFTAEWKNGRSVGKGTANGQLTFHDGLEYSEGEWTYCDGSDRKFYTERINGLNPAGDEHAHISIPLPFHVCPTCFCYLSGATRQVNQGTAREIPADTYDIGDGYLNPATRTVYTYEGAEVRKAGELCSSPPHFCESPLHSSSISCLFSSLPLHP